MKITDKRLDENVVNTNMSQVKLKIQNVKSIPAILGEIDVLKAAQLLPGISNGGEVGVDSPFPKSKLSCRMSGY